MAESVVVADNVELVANNIQNKVGATLIGLKSASEKTSNEISEPSIGILDGIRTFQQMTVEKVQGVWDILKAQLDYDKDVDRKIRENEDKMFSFKKTILTIILVGWQYSRTNS